MMTRHTLKIAYLVIIFIPQFLLADSFLKPNIRNHGSYKPIGSDVTNPLKPLNGHVPWDVGNAIKLTPVEGHKTLRLSIVLPLNNETELDQFLMDTMNPNSARYQQSLAQKEFMERYAPTDEQVGELVAYLTNQGIKLESVEPNRLIVKASGTVDVINQTFHTEIYNFEDEKGQPFYAPAYELQVDEALPIVSVLGLENRTKARSHHKRKSITPALWSQGLTPSGIQKAYSLPTGLNGAGQTLALFELDGFNQADITAYENAFNLPHVPLQVVLVDGVNGQPGSNAAEVVLDIELMIAIAGGVSRIIVYEGPNSGFGLVDTYNRIATDNLAKAISTSWGLSETQGSGSIVQAENQIFKQMVAQGQVLYAASGDSGAYDDGSTLSVDDPASQPLVVGVGGTHLNVDSNGNYIGETTWSYGAGPGEGGGGGISTIWTIPSWQQGVANTNNRASTTMRNVPDVSLDADPQTGYQIYYNGQWTLFGGTSCAAPLWAAFTALTNQQRASHALSTLPFPNPLLYQALASTNYHSLFHDITVGTNGYYPATAGYDLATGIGTYIGSTLIAYLAGTTTPPPVCTRANPTVSISPISQQSAAGGMLSYTVSVANNDTSACGSSTFNLSDSLPSGFSASLSQNSISLSPSSSGSALISVTSPHTASASNYSFSVSAANSSSPANTGSASATYVVQRTTSPILAISPQNASFTRNTTASFALTLANGQTPISGNVINIAITGPVNLTGRGTTGLSGSLHVYLTISNSFPLGTYRLTATTSYQGQTISSTTTFTVH